MARVNDHIQDELTARDVEVERYKRGVMMRVLRLLARTEEDVLAKVMALDPNGVQSRYRNARLTRLLAEVGRLVDQYGEALEAEVVPELVTLAQDEGAFGVRAVNSILPAGVAVEMVAPSKAILRAAAMTRPFQGRLLKEWVAEHPVAVRQRLRHAIRQGVAQGQTVDQMVRAIRGTAANGYSDGIMEVSRRGAQAMVRTAVNHVVTQAREATYEENSDLIKGVRMVATLDTRTSEQCRAIDGKVYPLGKGPRPPFHIGCRTSSVPVMKSWRELGLDLKEAPAGTRASMDGQVPEATTFNTWLKGRSAAEQDDMLGKTKGALFRRGGMSVDQFVDASGRSYTIQELRRREPEAFAKAEL